MEPIDWIEYVDGLLKKYRENTTNPFPNIFPSLQEYHFFLDDGMDLIPVVKYIYSKIYEKYKNLKPSILKLYLLSTYFLCIKFYSDVSMMAPMQSIVDIFEGQYSVYDVILVEIDILELIDYKFPLFPVKNPVVED